MESFLFQSAFDDHLASLIGWQWKTVKLKRGMAALLIPFLLSPYAKVANRKYRF